MMLTKLTLLLASMTANLVRVVGQGTDYLDTAPLTVYEAEELSPQNMDFDAANNMFVAHPGWYNDKMIHYYKFRIFAPGTYPDVITPGGTSAQVPVQKIFLVSTTGDFDGVVGMPIIEFHTIDGTSYSDFMNVVFVTAPEGYVANTFQSVGDITESGAEISETDIVLNIPVVPSGSTLQNPHTKGTDVAPIQPTMVFYRGQQIQTFVFEVTSESAATFFADTRDESTSPARQGVALSTGFEITVVPTMATPTFVSAIPLWHVNQFSNGVVEGMGGGPNPDGMRNVINLDRTDAGYSPLWNLLWATEMPINYMADEFSNVEQGSTDNGFSFFTTPMYVNCPDIGLVGDETNTLKAKEFMTMIQLNDANIEKFTLIGSAPALILTPDEPIMFVAEPSGETVGETVTNMMGGYEYDLMPGDIPEGTTEIEVMYNGESIRTIIVVNAETVETEAPNAGASTMSMALGAAIVTMVAAIATV